MAIEYSPVHELAWYFRLSDEEKSSIREIARLVEIAQWRSQIELRKTPNGGIEVLEVHRIPSMINGKRQRPA